MHSGDIPPPAATVLIANDHEWTARSIESILAPSGLTVVRAYTGQQALDRAASVLPDLVILDSQLPDIPGAEVCRRLRADERLGPTLPIIITTAGPSGRAQRLDAYRAGAWEFYGQPLDGEALLARLQTFLEARLALDRGRQDQLVDQASGLYSPAGLARRARELAAQAVRGRQPLACLVLRVEELAPDLEAGAAAAVDAAIAAHVGRMVLGACRASDVVGRLGPRTFGAIAAHTPPDGARRWFGRVAEAVEAAPVAAGGREFEVRVLGGVYAAPNFADAPIDPMEMLHRASAALEEARRGSPDVRLQAWPDRFVEATTPRSRSTPIPS